MNEHMRKMLQGRAEVIAAVRTQRGNGENFVEAGTVGAMLGFRGSDRLVYWFMDPQYVSDNQCSAHPKHELEVTGKRFDRGVAR